ncbi:MAG TPA: UDP-N-acetylglucosamine 2-epimerase (non-hydrolyzing) [Candidatus Koribacter sp.]
MMSTKIVTIVGARPQFIKAAAVSRVLRQARGVNEVLVHTGQHYDENMSAVFFREMDIPAPDYHLEIGSGAQGAQTGRMLEAIERVLIEQKPDWVLVYGDTNSTLAGALAAAKLHIPVAHVEAGLRSFNREMPEEINRVMTDHVASLLFAPSDAAVQNLKLEGLSDERVVRTGDVMYDAALFYESRVNGHARGVFEKLDGPYCLATIHRASNTDDVAKLRSIVDALSALAKQVPVVWPVHPRTRGAMKAHDISTSRHVLLIDPVGYLEMIALESKAQAIVTDSGGVQKEAYFFRVPCITLRSETEWVELVSGGYNRLCQPDTSALLAAFAGAMSERPNWNTNLYGDGHAASAITKVLCGDESRAG